MLFGELLADCFPDREVMGGAPFNVAYHLLGLGGGTGLHPVLVSRVGKDERGQRLLNAIQAAGLAADGVQVDSLHPTGTVQVTLDGSGAHRFEIAPFQAWDFIHADLARLIALARRPQWIYYGTLAQRGASRIALRALLRTTRARGFLDVNLRDPWVNEETLRWSLGKADTVKMNGEELLRIAAMLGLKGKPEALGERLLSLFGIRRLLVTQGEEGAWLLDDKGRYFDSGEVQPVTDAIDSVGAGDAFAAVFIIGMTQDWPIGQTLERAHRFAGEICRQRGAVPDSDDFYQPFIADWHLAG